VSTSTLARAASGGGETEIGRNDAASGARWSLYAAGLVLLAVLYYLSVRLGLGFRFQHSQIGVIWPANALLLSALLLVSPRRWWGILFVVAVAHAAAMAPTVPAWRIVWQIVGNSVFTLTAAAALRRVTDFPLRFETYRQVVAYTAVSLSVPALYAPTTPAFVRSLFDLEVNAPLTALVRTTLSNSTALMLIVPVVLLWAHHGLGLVRRAARGRFVEAAIMTLTLVGVGRLAFFTGPEIARFPWLLLWIIPPLLWAAVRFGPVGASSSLLLIAALSIWGTARQLGPFVFANSADQVLSLQLFWILLSAPVMLLAALFREREDTANALRRSEERFAKAFRSNPYAAVIVRQADAQVLEINERFASLVQRSRVDLVGRTVAALALVPESASPQLRRLLSVTEGLTDLELTMVDGNGNEHETLASTEPVEMGGEPCLIATFRDVTEQRQAEREAHQQRDQLAHVTRVATVGELSGALAHELSQPLTSILVNAQAALHVLGAEPVDLEAVREMLETIAQQDRQAGGVIAQLRSFLKEGESRVEALAFEELIRDALTLAHGAVVIGGVDVQVQLPADLPKVRGDSVQLLQVLVNLVVNACEAMSALPITERTVVLRGACIDGTHVVVSVVDRGTGLPRGREEQVFKPFFTTKEKGLGLGLAICRSIATAHGGRLWGENNAHRGATFHLVLPVEGATVGFPPQWVITKNQAAMIGPRAPRPPVGGAPETVAGAGPYSG
jgi:PAS domain S-box-containing protein